ncbi:amino acid adenylation domain-containing protein [Paucibacter sp. DJ1R-11]|uniref:non-ribosomal peptide synthetase n=1 Tax=Paucibacter sp. DJ1R-11 TaxID=2893556 RepID=UPI0021E4926E|nr:amino acid adenylation domain-containing protein [Paucibacter sp. DJ1R-11]MCV2363998.1 amino acid adenylation domain-containing protein [Paucibacter sp. DJ1R-11]
MDLPLSLSQREVWLDQRAWPGSAHLNIGGGALLRGPLDVARLQAALRLLVAGHDALRLAPDLHGHQRLLPAWDAQLERVDLHFASDLEAEQAMERCWNARMGEPFALDGRPPWRFLLLRAHDALHGLSIQFHHLVMDGWGTTQLMQAWCTLYQSLEPGATFAPREACAGARYRDFIEDSQRYRQSALFERDAAFWRQQLTGLARGDRQPLVARRAQPQSVDARELPRAQLFHLPLDASAYARMEQAAKAQGLSSFNVLLAAMALYFGRLSGQRKVLIGVPSLNRSGQRFRQTPGMFTGLQCLLLDLDQAGTASGLMQQAGTQMQAALRHARYPLSELAHELPGLHLNGQGEVLELLLSFERQDYRLQFGAAQLTGSRQLFSGRARFPLAMTLCEFDGGAAPALVLEASSACFEAEETALLARRLWQLSQSLAAQPEQALDQIELLPAEERWALLHGLHKDLAQLEAPQTWLSQFRHQAGLQPEACALVWDEHDTVASLSYAELLARAEALARQLRRLGAGRDRVVALAMERSAEMVVALVAIGLAGAAFLPLDPQAPPARLAGVLLDSGAVALLLDVDGPTVLAELPGLQQRCLRLPQPWPEFPDSNDSAASDEARAEDLAYVLFTSGSSGRPKGVMMEHGALTRRLAWLAKSWGIGPQDRAIQGTQLGFDPALVELLLPLSQGASIALPPPGRVHPRRLAELIQKHGASFGAFVPSTLAGLVDAWALARRQGQPAPCLRVACCGGELLPPALVRRFQALSSAQLYNFYGPTEACIFASAWPCPPAPAEVGADTEQADITEIPLGRPIDDVRIYVLDEAMQPLPFGCNGEIYIGGGGLARGYLGRPELDARAFVPDPWAPSAPGQPPARLYRSGDRGWLDAAGLLHFNGRLDRQVKLRGQRIELGDVEAACLRLPLVQQAAVQLLTEAQPPRLHAWLAGAGLSEVDLPRLQAGLRQSLPEVMRPGSFSLLAELPLGPHGKVQLAGLPPPPPLGPSAASLAPATYGPPRAPSNALEHRLLELWAEALPAAARAAQIAHGQAGHIDLDADFFALGGDSLAALGVLATLEDELGQRLPLQLMQEHPSIAALARALIRPLIPPGVLQRLGDAQAGTQRLFIAASGHGDVLRLQQLAQALAGEVAVFMLQPPLQEEPLSIGALAAMYADAMAADGDSSAWLAGFSVGGVTALAAAVELQQRGQAPAGLLLLDTIHPEAVLGGTAPWRTLGWLVRKLHVQDLSLNGRRLGAMFSDPGLVLQVQALRGHRCQAFSGPVLLLQSAGLAKWHKLLFQAWRRLLPELRNCQVAGTHGSIFDSSHVDTLAGEMLSFMRAKTGTQA